MLSRGFRWPGEIVDGDQYLHADKEREWAAYFTSRPVVDMKLQKLEVKPGFARS